MLLCKYSQYCLYYLVGFLWRRTGQFHRFLNHAFVKLINSFIFKQNKTYVNYQHFQAKIIDQQVNFDLYVTIVYAHYKVLLLARYTKIFYFCESRLIAYFSNKHIYIHLSCIKNNMASGISHIVAAIYYLIIYF